jgi:hypothetical protein
MQSVNQFIKQVAEIYQLPESDLEQMWNKEPKTVDYSSMKLTELKELCRQKKYKVGGTKKDLIRRLTDGGDTQIETKKVKKTVKETPSILKKIVQQQTLNISRNQFDMYVEKETNYVFNEISQSVTGLLDGKNVIPLTNERMKECWERNVSFRIGEVDGKYIFVNPRTEIVALEDNPKQALGIVGVDYHLPIWD